MDASLRCIGPILHPNIIIFYRNTSFIVEDHHHPHIRHDPRQFLLLFRVRLGESMVHATVDDASIAMQRAYLMQFITHLAIFAVYDTMVAMANFIGHTYHTQPVAIYLVVSLFATKITCSAVLSLFLARASNVTLFKAIECMMMGISACIQHYIYTFLSSPLFDDEDALPHPLISPKKKKAKRSSTGSRSSGSSATAVDVGLWRTESAKDHEGIADPNDHYTGPFIKKTKLQVKVEKAKCKVQGICLKFGIKINKKKAAVYKPVVLEEFPEATYLLKKALNRGQL